MSEALRPTPISKVRKSLYAERKDALSLEGLDASYVSLLEEVDALSLQIQEQKEYAMALADGDLSVVPPENNPLCASLIVLQQKLKGLTKLVQKAALGEPPQGAGSFGVLSDAFETLVQLYTQSEQSMPLTDMDTGPNQRLLLENNRLILSLAGALALGVVVVGAASREILFKSQRANVLLNPSEPECGICQVPCHLTQMFTSSSDEEVTLSRSWFATCSKTILHYQVNTHRILWEGQQAFIHFIEDVSRKSGNVSTLSERIYRDDETGLLDHRMCVDRIDAHLTKGMTFCACYFSIDGFQSVGDTLGSQEKEAYLQLVVDAIHRSIRNDDFFGRLSENAFLVIFQNLAQDIADRKFQAISLALGNMSKAKAFKASITHYALEAGPSIVEDAQVLLKSMGTRLAEKIAAQEAQRQKDLKKKRKSEEMK